MDTYADESVDELIILVLQHFNKLLVRRVSTLLCSQLNIIFAGVL